MKKIILILLSLLCLCSCGKAGNNNNDLDSTYLSLIKSINEHETFLSSSNYYDIKAEMEKINDGYRYYVTIDNPRIAMYDVEAIAIEPSLDYEKNMAANIGIFEDKVYCLIPNQKNTEKGYVSGIVISGIAQSPEVELSIYVSFKNADYSNTHTEYFKLNARYGEE